jgi:hypothetical protein
VATIGLIRMGFVAILIGVIDRIRAFVQHRDRPTAVANLVALVVALNGPLYPLYIVAMLGTAGWPGFLTCVSSPCFFAVPWLARRHPLAGRAALPVIGTLHTVWAVKVLGVDSGVDLFFLPCIMLATLLFPPRERWLRLFVMALALAPVLLPGSVYGTPVLRLSADDASRLASLNLGCVALLIGLITLQFAGLLSRAERPD